MNLSPSKLTLLRRWGLPIAILLFCLVPRFDRPGVPGEWQDLGWPVASLQVKVGYLHLKGPRGIYFQILDGFVPLCADIAFWFLLLYGLRRLGEKDILSRRVETFLLLTAITISYAWFLSGCWTVVRAWYFP